MPHHDAVLDRDQRDDDETFVAQAIDDPGLILASKRQAIYIADAIVVLGSLFSDPKHDE